MHGKENSSLLQATFVLLGFVFRNTHSDQCTGKSADPSSHADPRQPRHNRAGSDEWAQTRYSKKAYACQ